MKIVALIISVILSPFLIYSQSTVISSRIVNENKTPVEDALVMAYTSDTTFILSSLTDSQGRFNLNDNSSHCSLLKVSCLGYKSIWQTLPINGDIELISDNHTLAEITVKSKKSFTKQTTTGFIYDLSSINFVKSQNLLQSLRLVPFLDVNSNGEIKVNGQDQYLLYLNGKPFDMAMANTTQILRSIPAKTIKSIEVITEPDARFSNSVPVINIVTVSNSLKGVFLNGSAKYETVPNAGAGVSVMTNKDLLDFSFSYDYDYKGQHNQPIYQSITSPNNRVIIAGRGNGHWHTHLLRGLTSWRINNLNTIYVDFHAKINKDFFKTRWTETVEMPNDATDIDNRFSQSDLTKGTFEANLIYRNYFARNSKKEHFMVGYRYTYNPDKKNYTLDNPSNDNTISQKTNGGLNDHTLNFQLVIPLLRRHQMTIGARSIYRDANIKSTDKSDLSYIESITYPYLNYIGSFKGFNASVKLSCEYDYLSMKNLQHDNVKSTSHNVYFIPSVNISRNIKKWRVNLSYNRNLQRPSITMLNPFYNFINDYFIHTGNPDLKAEIKDAVSLGASIFKKTFNMSMSVTYSHINNAILNYQRGLTETNEIVSSFENIGKVNTLTGNIFANWQPIKSLVLKCNINGGLYNLNSSNLDLSQKDYTLNVFGWIDYYFSNGWNVGANVIHFKQKPDPFGTINSITNYGAHVEKSWFKGALSTSLEISNPFRKYSKLESNITNASVTTKRINYMSTRYLGIRISYTLQHGQKSKLKRDSSLKNDDQNSGVL